jgi:hypothetical protein
MISAVASANDRELLRPELSGDRFAHPNVRCEFNLCAIGSK